MARRIWATFRAQPAALFVALFVVPCVWNLPADLTSQHLLPDEVRDAGTEPVLDAVLLAFGMVWSCVIFGGELHVAIDSARGRRVSWRRFLDGIRHTLRLAFAFLAPFSPLIAITLLPPAGWLEQWALPIFLVAIPSFFMLLARTAFWSPLIVDSAVRLGAGLRATWNATRGRTWRILWLLFVFALPAAPVFAIEMIILDKSWISGALVGALDTLMIAHLYLLVPMPAVKALTPARLGDAPETGSEPEADGPRHGSGWTRPLD